MMMMIDFVVFVLLYATIFLSGFMQRHKHDNYALFATVLFLIQEAYIILYMQYIVRFDILAVSLCIALWMHKLITHRNMEEEKLFVGIVNNFLTHETGIAVTLSVGFTWYWSAC